MPSPRPSAAPISAVITLSCRIIRRAWRRVMPIARSMPSSRVRSNTERTSVFTMPNRLTTTENPSSTYSMARTVAVSFVESFAYASPVCSVASPESFTTAASAA